MNAHALHLSIAAATGPVAETVAAAADSPAVGQSFAFLIAIAAALAIGTLLFFWRWRANPTRHTSR